MSFRRVGAGAWVMRFRTTAAVLAAVASAVLPAAPASAGGPVRFRDVAEGSGVDFVYQNHPTARKHLIETMGGGLAAFDYDGDGLADLYFTNGASIPSLRKDSPKDWNRLYRNLGGMKFQDVTGQAGVAGQGYSIAAAAADYDNDGHIDLFVAGVGRNTLYRNRGDGTFEDVTEKAGIVSNYWSVGAVWFDYDRDGLLDLFVINYVKWSPDFDVFCGDADRGLRTYCHPRFFEGTPGTLYHNQGNGTFRDVSRESGIALHTGKGMAAAAADYDRDGLPDLFVTNDKVPNFLFHNEGNGRFQEVALQIGGALPDNGADVSSMGVDFRDYNNDGLPDIVITDLFGEMFPLFRNQAGRGFTDAGYFTRLAPLSRRYSGWGIGLFDFDNDGWKDVFTANSHVNDQVELFEPTRYQLHNSLFLNRGGTFEDVSAAAGLASGDTRAHRGAVFADFNNDGKVDVAVSSLGGRAELWENITDSGHTWLLLKLTGTRSNRDGIGAEVRLLNQQNNMTTAVGYASSSYFGVHFGTGALARVEEIHLRWPSGTTQILKNIRTNQILEVREGEQPRSGS